MHTASAHAISACLSATRGVTNTNTILWSSELIPRAKAMPRKRSGAIQPQTAELGFVGPGPVQPPPVVGERAEEEVARLRAPRRWRQGREQ